MIPQSKRSYDITYNSQQILSAIAFESILQELGIYYWTKQTSLASWGLESSKKRQRIKHQTQSRSRFYVVWKKRKENKLGRDETTKCRVYITVSNRVLSAQHPIQQETSERGQGN